MSKKLSHEKMIRRIIRVAGILANASTKDEADFDVHFLKQTSSDEQTQSDTKHTKS